MKKLLPFQNALKNYSCYNQEDLICFSTPLIDLTVDLLEELNNPIYKIASFEITDIPLIKYIASKQKPIIVLYWNCDKNDRFSDKNNGIKGKSNCPSKMYLNYPAQFPNQIWL